MLVNTLNGNRKCTTAGINKLLGITTPRNTLDISEITNAVEHFGLNIHAFNYDPATGKYGPNDGEPTPLPSAAENVPLDSTDAIVLTSFPYEETYHFWSVTYAFIESGIPVLLELTTSDGDDHLVTVFGHTTNFDEWHPQALCMYFGPDFARYLSSSFWADHFIIHDDNLGPYYSLSRHIFKPPVSPRAVLGVVKAAVKVDAATAELTALTYIRDLMSTPPHKPQPRGPWWDHIQETDVQKHLCLRTMLMEKGQYLAHIRSLSSPDGSSLDPLEIECFSHLPDVFWMSEFSLPDLFTANKSKLGEALLDCRTAILPGRRQTGDMKHLVLAVRFPSLLVIPQHGGDCHVVPSAVSSHTQIFRRNQNMTDW